MKASFDTVNKLAKQEEELSEEETARLQVRNAAMPHKPDLANPLRSTPCIVPLVLERGRERGCVALRWLAMMARGESTAAL
jgi:hypothetical protein